MPDWPTATITTVEALTAEVATLDFENEELRESFADLQLALEDRGWLQLTVNAAQQFTRDGIGRAAALCRILAVANPLVKRGLMLRHSYVWGQGVEISGRNDDVNTVIGHFDKDNRSSLTGGQAREELERALGTDGNVFLALFTSPLTGRVRVRSFPFDEIVEVYANPDDRDDPWFYLRRWTSYDIDQQGRRNTIRSEAWYPALGYRPRARWKFIDDVQVMWDAPLKHISVNRLDGWDFGVGDAYAAMTWARAYKEFLADWAGLTKALSKFAWRLTGDSKSKTQRAADKVRANAATSGDQAGATAAMAGANLEAIPKTGATIDSDSGRPLAAMIAAALGFPVTMLLADPGQTGARAVAETLDQPTRLEMGGRRDLWASALRAVYDYVIDQSIKAPQGILTGVVGRDEYGDELITLVGDDDTDRTVDIDWPDIDKTDPLALVQAIVSADDTGKVPELVIARLLLMALGVENLDEVLDDLTDDAGNWAGPAVTAGDVATQRFRDGQDPAAALR